ncbi:hypothetical protein [Nannocystis pusilla]
MAGWRPWNSSTFRGHSLCSRVDTNREAASPLLLLLPPELAPPAA